MARFRVYEPSPRALESLPVGPLPQKISRRGCPLLVSLTLRAPDLITTHDTIVSGAADGLRKAALCQVTFGQLADEATDMSAVELLSGPHASRFTNTDIRTRQLLGHSFLKEEPPMPRLRLTVVRAWIPSSAFRWAAEEKQISNRSSRVPASSASAIGSPMRKASGVGGRLPARGFQARA